ncbi:hypothetical protein BC938DRAFT_482196 [Jimgerdemannia flammicorona]|uniref:Uncharacterized protein n=1 Tax=Jimgerdemannia flammicorona TaxID=994334 RepID=A0A433QED2_9FUNG|nr:hypothetical protein BC938DRAFT_482196 [Jimgerdemannia flammicorona]
MEDVREFRPYEHTFDGRDAGYVTATFPKRRRGTVRTVNQGGAKSVATPEDAWFYRYDQKHVEVRDVARCREKVFASLHVSRLQEEEGEEVIRVLHTMVNDERALLIAATDKQTAECRFVFFNPFTLAMTALPLGVTVMGTIISVSVSEPYAPSEIDVQNYMAQGQAPPRSYNLLVVGMADSTVHVNKLFQHADNIVVVCVYYYCIP